jgi:hypothetical protein
MREEPKTKAAWGRALSDRDRAAAIKTETMAKRKLSRAMWKSMVKKRSENCQKKQAAKGG